MNFPPEKRPPGSKNLLPDYDSVHRHQSLKRWERHEQRAALKRRAGESSAPPLPCFWRTPAGETVVAPAHVLGLFEGDLMVVRFVGPLEFEAGVRVLRAGIPWEHWGPFLLRAYARDVAVPDAFRPRRRLPPEWLEKAEKWRADDQRAFFERLRAAGLLPRLPKMTADNVGEWLRWEEVRERFVDFR